MSDINPSDADSVWSETRGPPPPYALSEIGFSHKPSDAPYSRMHGDAQVNEESNNRVQADWNLTADEMRDLRMPTPRSKSTAQRRKRAAPADNDSPPPTGYTRSSTKDELAERGASRDEDETSEKDKTTGDQYEASGDENEGSRNSSMDFRDKGKSKQQRRAPARFQSPYDIFDECYNQQKIDAMSEGERFKLNTNLFVDLGRRVHELPENRKLSKS